MALPFTLTEDMKIVYGLITDAAGAASSAVISLKTCQKAFIVITHRAPSTGQVRYIPQTDSAIAAGTLAVLTTNVPIWVNANCAASDTFVQQADAVNYQTAADANPKMIVFEIDPAKLPAGEDCLNCATDGNVLGDFMDITFYLVPRYPGPAAQQPSTLVD